MTISKEKPFARELRLSRVAGSPTSSSSSFSDNEEESAVKASRTQNHVPKTKSGQGVAERRKSKVSKRHRLNKNEETLVSRVGSPMELDINVDVDVEDETPALSPSYSESGSERSIPAYFDHKSVSQEKEREFEGETKVERIPTVVFRGISISQLLT